MNGPWMDLVFDLILITFGVLIAAVPSHLYTSAANRRQARQERLYRVESDVRQLENLGIRYWLRPEEDGGRGSSPRRSSAPGRGSGASWAG